MIERHVTFSVLPGKNQDFEKLFVEEYRPAMTSMPGFIGVYLLVEQDNPQSYHMVIRFRSAEEAANWRSSQAHQALQPKIKALYQESRVQVYEVVA
ncbi:MAG: antibiotic biosynthesis monooxygenase family protein [Anaerolineales bacterium]